MPELAQHQVLVEGSVSSISKISWRIIARLILLKIIQAGWDVELYRNGILLANDFDIQGSHTVH